MRNSWLVAMCALVLAALACNTPQPTTLPVVCTPPPCQEGEVYYCAGDCPGGCGVQCATPTPGEPTVTSSPAAPTDTPIIVCTPPPCTGLEVYYCPGECPGGCGTQCATPTAVSQSAPPTAVSQPASAPMIHSFTADRTTIVEGESVTLSWQATGGTEASIQWVTWEAVLANAPGPLNPDGGAATITPDGDGDITLIVRNRAGSTEAHVQLTIECLYDWASALPGPPPLASGCPGEMLFGNAAQQSFENGFMIWTEASRTIYVFYYPQGSAYPTYGIYADNFHEGDIESDPAIVPPPGLYQPVRGFGLLWRVDPSVRDRLGWATAPEAGFQAWLQGYTGTGMHSYFTLIQGIDGTIYHLTATGSVWEVYTP